MEGTAWRLTELQNGTVFTVTQADCDHAGNRSTGRDRVFVTWQNADGSEQTDHLDMRYCEGGGGKNAGSSEPEAAETEEGECGEVEVDGCPAAVAVADSTASFEPAEGELCPGEGNGGGGNGFTARRGDSTNHIDEIFHGQANGCGVPRALIGRRRLSKGVDEDGIHDRTLRRAGGCLEVAAVIG